MDNYNTQINTEENISSTGVSSLPNIPSFSDTYKYINDAGYREQVYSNSGNNLTESDKYNIDKTYIAARFAQENNLNFKATYDNFESIVLPRFDDAFKDTKYSPTIKTFDISKNEEFVKPALNHVLDYYKYVDDNNDFFNNQQFTADFAKTPAFALAKTLELIPSTIAGLQTIAAGGSQMITNKTAKNKLNDFIQYAVGNINVGNEYINKNIEDILGLQNKSAIDSFIFTGIDQTIMIGGSYMLGNVFAAGRETSIESALAKKMMMPTGFGPLTKETINTRLIALEEDDAVLGGTNVALTETKAAEYASKWTKTFYQDQLLNAKKVGEMSVLYGTTANQAYEQTLANYGVNTQTATPEQKAKANIIGSISGVVNGTLQSIGFNSMLSKEAAVLKTEIEKPVIGAIFGKNFISVPDGFRNYFSKFNEATGNRPLNEVEEFYAKKIAFNVTDKTVANDLFSHAQDIINHNKIISSEMPLTDKAAKYAKMFLDDPNNLSNQSILNLKLTDNLKQIAKDNHIDVTDKMTQGDLFSIFANRLSKEKPVFSLPPAASDITKKPININSDWFSKGINHAGSILSSGTIEGTVFQAQREINNVLIYDDAKLDPNSIANYYADKQFAFAKFGDIQDFVGGFIMGSAFKGMNLMSRHFDNMKYNTPADKFLGEKMNEANKRLDPLNEIKNKPEYKADENKVQPGERVPSKYDNSHEIIKAEDGTYEVRSSYDGERIAENFENRAKAEEAIKLKADESFNNLPNNLEISNFDNLHSFLRDNAIQDINIKVDRTGEAVKMPDIAVYDKANNTLTLANDAVSMDNYMQVLQFKQLKDAIEKQGSDINPDANKSKWLKNNYNIDVSSNDVNDNGNSLIGMIEDVLRYFKSPQSLKNDILKLSGIDANMKLFGKKGEPGILNNPNLNAGQKIIALAEKTNRGLGIVSPKRALADTGIQILKSLEKGSATPQEVASILSSGTKTYALGYAWTKTISAGLSALSLNQFNELKDLAKSITNGDTQNFKFKSASTANIVKSSLAYVAYCQNNKIPLIIDTNNKRINELINIFMKTKQ